MYRRLAPWCEKLFSKTIAVRSRCPQFTKTTTHKVSVDYTRTLLCIKMNQLTNNLQHVSCVASPNDAPRSLPPSSIPIPRPQFLDTMDLGLGMGEHSINGPMDVLNIIDMALEIVEGADLDGSPKSNTMQTHQSSLPKQ